MGLMGVKIMDDQIVLDHVNDLIIQLRERGYDFELNYTLNEKGEFIELKLRLIGRFG